MGSVTQIRILDEYVSYTSHLDYPEMKEFISPD